MRSRAVSLLWLMKVYGGIDCIDTIGDRFSIRAELPDAVMPALDWEANNSLWWKFLPPIVVGYHGGSIHFDESQMKLNEEQGNTVTPYSLYEAQLRKRLGAVPAWLNSLQ